MKCGKATNQMLIIYAFLGVVLMFIYQRMKDLKWVPKQRRPSSLDMALVLKSIHRLFDTDTSSPEKREWMKAMISEINSLNTNKVLDLAELPCGRKAIGSKWVFKRKYGSGGNMKQHKARIVAQGFFQKHGVDYDETFSPVVRFESVRSTH